ncbi:MAG: AraC family transcriptional regulator [Chloroflexi bacterium]|nr:AraC family transcriptional regulator [Chloroflexota bacterium]
MTDEPAPVERDSRGILDPWLLRQRLALTRYPPGDELDGLIDHFWAIRWELPDAEQHRQEVLTHPVANLSVSHPDARSGSRAIEARLSGVARKLTDRVVAGRGWVVAAMTTPGGLGAFLTGSAARLTDRSVPLGSALQIDEAALIAEVTSTADQADRVAILRVALARAVVPRRIDPARQVAEIARLAETDRAVRQLGELSQKSGVSQRTLQRMFLEYAGVSPSWVLRRYRLLDAAEAVRNGERVSWTDVAATLGYADQAHLIRDFRAATGRTPAAYAQAQSGHQVTPPPAVSPR